MALHFGKRVTMALDPNSKARAFAIGKRKSEKLELIFSYHGNTMMKYSVSAKKHEDEETKEITTSQ